MSTILYHVFKGKIEKELVEANRVATLLGSGYAVSPEELTEDKPAKKKTQKAK